MQEIFIAIILIFDAQTSQLAGAATAAFTDRAVCEAEVARITERAAADMTIAVEGECLATSPIGAR